MNISEELKEKLKKNSSPIIALLLFATTFIITVTLLKSCTYEVDRFDIGKAVRSIVDGEKGDVVADINGTEYYQRDLDLMWQTLRLTEPEYESLKEDQRRALAGQALIKQKMLLCEFERLGLTVSDEEFESYLAEQKDDAYKKISADDDDAKAIMDYISGYGCTYSEYWEDAYVLQSYRDNIKLDKVNAYICEKKGGSSNMSGIYVEQYLAQLIEDGTYKVKLFGEDYK